MIWLLFRLLHLMVIRCEWIWCTWQNYSENRRNDQCRCYNYRSLTAPWLELLERHLWHLDTWHRLSDRLTCQSLLVLERHSWRLGTGHRVSDRLTCQSLLVLERHLWCLETGHRVSDRLTCQSSGAGETCALSARVLPKHYTLDKEKNGYVRRDQLLYVL